MALVIDNCQICRQRSELQPLGDGRAVCGDCFTVMKNGATKVSEAASEGAEFSRPESRPQQSFQSQPVFSQPEDPDLEERNFYLSLVQEEATDEWVNKFIKEVVSRKILKYDWKKVLENKRWFSTLDLRRFALEVNPDFEKPEVVPNEDPGDNPGEAN